jgi:hypothetical protein
MPVVRTAEAEGDAEAVVAIFTAEAVVRPTVDPGDAEVWVARESTVLRTAVALAVA